MKKSERQFDADKHELAGKELKANNTALLAQALQPSWTAQSGPAFRAAVRRHGPPAGYEHRSSTAVFWINMHRAAIGVEAFTAKDFMSLAGDYVSRFV